MSHVERRAGFPLYQVNVRLPFVPLVQAGNQSLTFSNLETNNALSTASRGFDRCSTRCSSRFNQQSQTTKCEEVVGTECYFLDVGSYFFFNCFISPRFISKAHLVP